MHALGFVHEQNRVDRDDWVTIVEENIGSGWIGQYLKNEMSRETNQGQAYDYGSVMHYSAKLYVSVTTNL